MPLYSASCISKKCELTLLVRFRSLGLKTLKSQRFQFCIIISIIRIYLDLCTAKYYTFLKEKKTGVIYMKRILALIFLVAICLTLCSCGSEDLDNTNGLVSQMEKLVSGVSKDPATSLAGEWVLEYDPSEYANTLILNEDMTYKYGPEKSGTWTLSDDQTMLYLINQEDIIEYDFLIFEEDEFTKILFNDFVYVRAEDHETAFNKKYEKVWLNNIQYGEYLGELKFVGNPPNNWSSFPCSFYMIDSLAYDNGLVYVGHSKNFTMTLTFDYGNDSTTGTCSAPFGFLGLKRTNGEAVSFTVDEIFGAVYFIRSDYVEDVYSEGDSCRVISLKSGYNLYDYENRYWDLVPNANPEDFPM